MNLFLIYIKPFSIRKVCIHKIYIHQIYVYLLVTIDTIAMLKTILLDDFFSS